MKVSLREHKVPLGVTSVGLIMAAGLAIAPSLLAESDSEILTKKNATDIAALTATIEKQTALIDTKLASQASASAGINKDLEIQVITLNKAVSNLSNTVRNKVTPATDTEALQGSMKFADGRLVNLEKAVTNLHRKQQAQIKESADSRDGQSLNTSTLANLESRLLILEKAVTRLHQRQIKAKNENPVMLSSAPSQSQTDEQNLAVSKAQSVEQIPEEKSEEKSEQIPVRQEVAAVSPEPESAFKADLERLEKIVSQMSALQTGNRVAGSGSVSGSTRNISKIINARTIAPGSSNDGSLQVRHLERTLTQINRRLNLLEQREQEQEVAVDQLFEIRDYIDSLLNGID